MGVERSGARVGMLVLACRWSYAHMCCVSDTRALALVSQVRDFMHVLDQRAGANLANAASMINDGDVLTTAVPAKTPTESASTPCIAPPGMPSESEPDVEVETITEADARGAGRENYNTDDAQSRVQRAKQLLKDGDFLTAGQLLRSAANDGNGEACAIISEILEQQNQHTAAAELVKVGCPFVWPLQSLISHSCVYDLLCPPQSPNVTDLFTVIGSCRDMLERTRTSEPRQWVTVRHA